MKALLLDTDPRSKIDPFYSTNMGSFSIVSDSFNKGLREIGCLAQNIEEADWIGISDGLNVNFSISNKKTFVINVWDCINVLPNQLLNKNKTTKIIGLSNQISNLWNKYGHEVRTAMPGTDTDFWKPTLSKNNKFTFLFDSFANVRSGLDLALQAYELAFRNNSNVQLIIKNTSESEQLGRKILELKKICNINFINKRTSFEEMRDLYSSSHVMLSVMRHSSWGLGVHQAMACDCLPIIGDFCPSNDMAAQVKLKPSKEIEIQSLLPELIDSWGLHNAYGNFSYSEQPRFYDYSIEEYANLMLNIFNNWGNKYSLVNNRKPILENWSLKQAAQNLINALNNYDR